MAVSNLLVHSLRLIYYSPTGTTRRVLESIARGVDSTLVQRLDLTYPSDFNIEIEEELTIIGAPVYGGRIPKEAIKRLNKVKANCAAAAVVVVYGNRAYEDALLELKNVAEDLGFRPMAGGAFIGEHSYSTDDTPIAPGRPDMEDLDKAATFGMRISEKLERIKSACEVKPIDVPGNFPYKERRRSGEPISPSTDREKCILCGRCSSACPTAAITVEATVQTRREACTMCCACVKVCPTGARKTLHPRIRSFAEWLHKNHGQRKEPEIFL